MNNQKRLRNIGISAHIDAGKTTLTERMLYYCGRVHKVREVHGGGGATMDSDPLEKKRGITINSAATTVRWRDHQINVIDTPGHVDFTVEVERSLRVLDGAVLVLCSVGGVQSQSLTVDRQMRRYEVPRIAMINKMDRMGANPDAVVKQLRTKLNANPVVLQIPIGKGASFIGVVDLVKMRAVYFEGVLGQDVQRAEIPDYLSQQAKCARTEMLETLAMLDDGLLQSMLAHEPISTEDIRRVVRKATVERRLTPVLMGSAYQNKGVQEMLDAVTLYLPAPCEREVYARNSELADQVEGSPKVRLQHDKSSPLVAMSFKTDMEKFGQLTYLRVYQGQIQRGESYRNARTGKKFRVGRLVKIHADQREEIDSANAGEIVGMIGVDCASGDTFTDPQLRLSMENIQVPDPVVRLAIAPGHRQHADRLAKALERFRRDDPTFQVSIDSDSGETIIAGMGQLHLEIYIDRIESEYKCVCEVGKPSVAYQERPTCSGQFAHRYKKQNGGQGQFAHIEGRFDVLDESSSESFLFEDQIVGGRIGRKFISATRHGFASSLSKGPLGQFEVVGVKITLQDGAQHQKDSNEFAFRNCAAEAMKKVILPKANVALWEPVMRLESVVPGEFQGAITADLGRKRGLIQSSEVVGNDCVVVAVVPLAELFDYASDLRSMTSGTGSFALQPDGFKQVPEAIQHKVLKERMRNQAR